MIDAATLVGKNWSALRREALAFAADPPPDAFDLAVHWSGHPAWEVRFFAVVVLGNLAAREPRALAHLYDACGQDESWQVNEALAMAFDDYCAASGYERALPELRRWLAAPSPNLRRAVLEGLSPWTGPNARPSRRTHAWRSSCSAR